MNLEVTVSPEFRRQAARAVWSIVLFIASYILLLVASVALTALCIYGGIMMIAAKPTFITLALGIGLASLGILVVFFMLKFILASNKTDRSHLVEIKRADQPQLFALIDEIVAKVGTHFPKKVFLSADVNAAVFYDSTFWSMFFPVRKNLQIGLGLVNTVSKSELTAVLSHEFGHFSQRSMKVGSYVHNVNQILHNLLYENEGYDEMAQRWANASGYFALFVLIAVWIVHGIKWVLSQLYKIVNKNYLALSREMEFNADELAAHVTGYKPLKTSLLRMTLADRAFQIALSFYESNGNCKPGNFYHDQMFLLTFMGRQNDLSFIDGLPQLGQHDLSRYNKSKLKVTDQWASHPSDEDRILMLEKTGQDHQPIDTTPANSLLHDCESVQQKLTLHLFRDFDPENQWKVVGTEDFSKDYVAGFNKNKLPDIYRGYYDDKNPLPFDPDDATGIVHDLDALFSDAMIDAVYTQISLKNDIETIRLISNPASGVATFDYDGVRYAKKDGASLIEKLDLELVTLTETIRENDKAIYRAFAQMESDESPKLKALYKDYFEFDRAFDIKSDAHNELSDSLGFIHVATPNEQIKSNLQKVSELEETFQLQLRSMVEDDFYRAEISSEAQESFNIYLGGERRYFADDKYIDADLVILFSAMQHYSNLLSRSYYLVKRNLLDYQAGLVGELVRG